MKNNVRTLDFLLVNNAGKPVSSVTLQQKQIIKGKITNHRIKEGLKH